MVREYPKNKGYKLSEHFNALEFQCKCKYPDCTMTYIDDGLIDYLEKKRDRLGKSITINSGFRCTRHNRDIGGKKGSIHMTGKAADIVVSGEDMLKLADVFEDADGLGRYKNFLHVDVRGYRARWNG